MSAGALVARAGGRRGTSSPRTRCTMCTGVATRVRPGSRPSGSGPLAPQAGQNLTLTAAQYCAQIDAATQSGCAPSPARSRCRCFVHRVARPAAPVARGAIPATTMWADACRFPG